MTTRILSFLFILGFNFSLTANEPTQNTDSSFYAEIGYRMDELDWNIASDMTGASTPNIISELTWSDLEIINIKAGLNTHLIENEYNEIFLHGSVATGYAISGDNQDSDYNGNNRTQEFSRSNNNSSGSTTKDYQIDINAAVKFPLDNTTKGKVIGSLGYEVNTQNLVMTDGYQTIDTVHNNLGPFAGLNSTFDAKWSGLFLGLGFEIIAPKHEFKLFAKLHDLDYYAEADWNLRSDFQHPKSYDHNADGNGTSLNLKYSYSPKPELTYYANLEKKDFETDPGVITFFLSSGSIAQQRINQTNWTSSLISFGVNYKFDFNQL